MIRINQSHLPVVAQTHPGMTGKNNEDRYSVTAYLLSPAQKVPVLVAVLADGIGGHRAGEVAAQIAVDRVTQVIGDSDAVQPIMNLRQAVETASQEIFNTAQSGDRQGMGATCVCAWIIGTRLFAATVGDSRLYMMRSGTIRQLSTDHTWIQEALERGVLTPEQVRGHPNAHVIRRYLGSPKPPSVDFRLRLEAKETDTQAEANQGLELATGDRILLCSDGLTDLVEPVEILAAFQPGQPMDVSVNNLVNLACERGGHDNITIVVIEIPPQPVAPVKRRTLSWLLWSLVALVLIAGIVGIGLALNHINLGTGSPSPTASPPALTETIQSPILLNSPTTASRSATPAATQAGTPVPPFVLPPGGPTITAWPTDTKAP